MSPRSGWLRLLEPPGRLEEQLIRNDAQAAASHSSKLGPASFAPGPGSAAPSGNDCPDSHPVKANREGGIYHLRGGVFYDRTRPEVCYATADDAERAGYRRSQR